VIPVYTIRIMHLRSFSNGQNDHMLLERKAPGTRASLFAWNEWMQIDNTAPKGGCDIGSIVGFASKKAKPDSR
jgi:hypothetical protein